MRLENVAAESYSKTSAICRLTFAYHPSTEWKRKGVQDWSFTNVYGYRAGGPDDIQPGWEFVLRDEESSAMEKATGSGFKK